MKKAYLGVGFVLASLLLVSAVMLFPTANAGVEAEPVQMAVTAFTESKVESEYSKSNWLEKRKKKCGRIPDVKKITDRSQDAAFCQATGGTWHKYKGCIRDGEGKYAELILANLQGNPCGGGSDSRCKHMGCSGYVGGGMCGGCGPDNSLTPLPGC